MKYQEDSFLGSFLRRIICYFIGFVISCLIMWINTLLGHGEDLRGMLAMTVSPSIVFGFMIYNIYFNTPLYRETGRYICYSKEGILHLAMCFLVLVLISCIRII